jgi:hypothetical protein
VSAQSAEAFSWLIYAPLYWKIAFIGYRAFPGFPEFYRLVFRVISAFTNLV